MEADATSTTNNQPSQTPTKPWWQSKTIISAVISLIISFAAIYHVQLNDLAQPLTDGIYAGLTLISIGATIYGRIKAVHKLK
jgi:hypothetical protein